MWRIVSRRNRTVQQIPRPRVILLLKTQFRHLFQSASRRIVQNLRLERQDPRPSSESPKRPLQQPQIRYHLRKNVHPSSQHSSENDDPQPIPFRSPLHEVPQRDSLNNDSPRIKAVTQSSHLTTPRRFLDDALAISIQHQPHWANFCFCARSALSNLPRLWFVSPTSFTRRGMVPLP